MVGQGRVRRWVGLLFLGELVGEMFQLSFGFRGFKFVGQFLWWLVVDFIFNGK